MENIAFKGLEKVLNEGCYIKVFYCMMKYPVVQVLRKNDQNQEELILDSKNGNILSALVGASSKIAKEIIADLLDNGGAFTITTGKLYWPDEKTCIHGKGIKVYDTVVSSKDAAISKAVEILAKK